MLTERGILLQTIRFFGEENQYRKFQEEACEASASVNRFLCGYGSEEDMLSELADIEIMIEQMRIMTGGWSVQRTAKLKRLKGMIKDEG